MPAIPYGRTAFERTRGALPRLPVVNMILEKAPTEADGVVMQSRRGLVEQYEVGSGPVRLIHQEDGVLGGVRFTVSGGNIYSGTTLLGPLFGQGPVSAAGNATRIVFTAGEAMKHWDGTTLSTVSFPDGAGVTKVLYVGGRFIAIRAGSQRWYFSAVGIPNSWDGLDYASAENRPDTLLDAIEVNGILVLLGSQTVEFWAPTGDAELPFSPIQQRVFDRGTIGTGCAVKVDNSFIWIGEDGIVYRGGNVPEPVSDDGYTADILASVNRAVYLVNDERHKLVCIRLDSKTLALDVTTQGWSEFSTVGRDNFRAQCSDGTFLGDDETGKVWRWGGYSDAGAPLERRLAGGFPINGGSVRINNVRVRCEVGGTDALTGYDANPVIEMRASTDYGKTWGGWEAEPLGRQGEYRTMPEWRALGLADYPAALFEWRVSDPVGLRFSGAYLNEQGGGRER